MDTDPFILRARLGGAHYSKYHKEVAALRGVPEAEGKYHTTLYCPFALSQIATFYIGESVKVRGLGWTVKSADFWIIAGNPMAEHQVLGECQYLRNDKSGDPYWGYHIAGHFDVLAHGDGKTRALRLLKWWLEWEPTLPRRRDLALHLGRQIAVKGQKEPKMIIGPYDIEIDDVPAFSPAEWDIEL